MKKFIKKIKIHNFKKFDDLTITFDESLNIFIGDNEAGKSTILTAIDLVLSGSRNKVENLGIDKLFNITTIKDFLESDKSFDKLPKLYVELYLGQEDEKGTSIYGEKFRGKFNSEDVNCDGLLLECVPNDDLSDEIAGFYLFSGEAYTGYSLRNELKHLTLDSSQISNDAATKHYIKRLFQSHTDTTQTSKLKNEYRKQKDTFTRDNFASLNGGIDDYSFAIRSNSKSNLTSDLTIREDDIDIANKGKGRQCFIKTDFALRKSQDNLDIVLLEEPENHLSHTYMHQLIQRINETQAKQLFIATHSNLISARLDLRKAILLNSNNNQKAILNELTSGTAKFFMKAPNSNILQFILSQKVILVEGDAEFILMEAMYEKVTNEKLSDSGVHIISVGGTSFKRYLEIAELLEIKTAVIRDNDKDYDNNCIERYKDYSDANNIEVFSDKDNSVYTFEIALYNKNESICEGVWSAGRRSLSVLEFMLKNKADCAFELLEKQSETLEVPDYIKEAIEWIKD